MFKFEFTYNEAALMHRILHSYLSELENEMAANKIEGFNELLKDEQALMQKMLDYFEAHGIGISAEEFGGFPE